MKVAILASVAWRTPPRKYGPWEQVAYDLTEGLHARGIEVTLFATSDSLTNAKLESACATPYAEDETVDAKVAECLHISHLMENAGQFDLIHNHFDFLPLTYSRLIQTPLLTTIHGFSSQKIKEVYRKYNGHTGYVSISDSDRDPELDYLATVYNGIDADAFPFVEEPGDYLLFFGRIHPDKGTREAIQIALNCGRKLMIAGLIQDNAYFENEVKPYIDDKQICYCGNVGPGEKQVLLGKAFALLHPVKFEEPFGLSVAESMFCGTPVIAFRRGSMPELLLDGKSGFLVSNVEEAVDAVAHIPRISRAFCRQWAASKFSREKMVEGYEAVYNKMLNR
ncbi:glycosyltransferase family 4 protein [Dyadobacter aurulentus]|uniref:glycosyltransferase family 4 protein n=1 Tax=Dyadobacter sp. UC 10 TaxID=2605428 RepID=UPI0011F296E7|nr:glycosyltransferase family 4 protein [Dyadobacter sp. UC 10]KAA0988678.1 glycosyltransferase family 4 protein [Dyadobacter sp. UC 10]